jgi:hypothetical protein
MQWSNKVAGRGMVPSDRLRPANSPRATPASSKPGSAKSSGRATPEPPKSEAVKKLEALLESVKGKNAGTKPDPKGGCFCQGVHCRTAAIAEERD